VPALQVDGPLQQQLPQLQLALACAELGARLRTIVCLTGLGHQDLVRMLFRDGRDAPRGRAPDSPEWFHTANLLDRAQACVVLAIYHRLTRDGFAAPQALLTSYRHYRNLCTDSRISFDRAFDLAAHLDGRWVATESSFTIAACGSCCSDVLAPYGARAETSDHCPFCKLVKRFRCDPRVQQSFPTQPLPDLTDLALARERLFVSASQGRQLPAPT
jgi:flagellar transcriptional activator FlhC